MSHPVAGHELVERALALSQADAAIVFASETSAVNLRFANNTLTTNGSTVDRDISVISIIGKSFGVRSASVVEGSALVDLVRASEADARAAGDAPDYFELQAENVSSDFTDGAEHTSTAVLDDFAKELAVAFARSRSGNRRLFGFAYFDMSTLWLGTSTGVRVRHTRPTGWVHWTAKSTAERGSVWHGQSTVDFKDVSPMATEALLAKRLHWCEHSIDLPAGRYETLLPPPALADLLIYSYWSSGGLDAAKGRTAFAKPGGGTRAGEKLAIAGFNMWSDPSDSQLPTAPFVVAGSSSSELSVFDNGVPAPRTSWIEDGVLSALMETRASASERNVAFTPAQDNLIADAGGSASIEDMVAATQDGLLLTCVWYTREIDPKRLLLTGLTRDGVYKVENGEIVGVVNNFRWNESPLELLGRITETGKSVPTLAREFGSDFNLTKMPPVRVADFNMSTVSPAN